MNLRIRNHHRSADLRHGDVAEGIRNDTFGYRGAYEAAEANCQ
jgi:hypothetical protein